MALEQLLFPSRNRWGIPDLLPQEFGTEVLDLPLYPYGSRRRSGIGHFFLIDRRFEAVWRQPLVGLKAVQRFEAVCTPDFSLYRDRPLAEQLHNVYRNRWCGRFWQSRGLNVIPTIGWSTGKSYPFCFIGVPTRQILAIGTPDLRHTLTRKVFKNGLRKMLEVLSPRGLIVFGRPARSFSYEQILPRKLPCVVHPNRWELLRTKLKRHPHKKGNRK